MLYYDWIDVSEGIDVNKRSALKERDVSRYWYFLNYNFKIQPNVYYRCYDLLMMSVKLSDIAVLNIKVKGSIISLINKTEPLNLLQNADLTEKRVT